MNIIILLIVVIVLVALSCMAAQKLIQNGDLSRIVQALIIIVGVLVILQNTGLLS